MSKQTMQMLRGRLCKELDEVAQVTELNTGMIEIIHKLTDTIKNIDKIEALEGGGEYSGRMGYSRYSGEDMSPYNGDPYARYSRNGYSMHGNRAAEKMREIMNDGGLNQSQREAVRKALEMLENG